MSRTNIGVSWWWIGFAVLCALVAAASLGVTQWFGLDPCHLCIFQRLLLMLMVPVALLAVLPRPFQFFVRGVFLMLAASGVATAAYQTWLQLQPEGSVTCVGTDMSPIEHLVEWLGRLQPTLFMPSGFCEDRELVILGLSLANWALVLFVCLLLAALWRMRMERGRIR